jgi:aspartyl protease family protein
MGPFKRMPARIAGAALLMACGVAAAQGVQFAGTMGSKALLVIDGVPKTLGVGESHAGVRLVSMADGQAQVERGGARLTLVLGGAPVAVGGGVQSRSSAREIVLAAGPGGHFITQGSINGRQVQFMVDTGATSVALGRNEADRIGLDWKAGRQVIVNTANGQAIASVVTLSAVRVGEVTVSNVSAVVSPAPMPYVLLGNSFLTRFQMRRENDVMRLELR